MSADRIVVIGSGMAATRLVERLVARGVCGLTVLGDEPCPPYNRILLSAVLEGTHRVEAIMLRSPQWYADHGVTLRTGARVLDIDRKRREVMLVDGERVPYDTLVLATGSIPTLPPIRGLVRMDGTLNPAVHPFRSIADCARLGAALPGSRRAVVIGGGLLGLQVARALGIRGLEVEIVEGGEHLLRGQVGAEAGGIIARDLKRLGTSVYTGARAVRLSDDRLRLDNGYELQTDLVVLAAGGRPSTALAKRAGLGVGRGITVDDRLRACERPETRDEAPRTDPRVHALGDCAEHDRRLTGFVAPAWEQAELLADHLAGDVVSYAGARTVARLRATDLDVAVLGEPELAHGQSGSQTVEVTNPVTGSHRKLVVRDGVIVAAELVGDLSRIGLITQHYDRGTVLGPHEAGELLLAERAPRATALPDDAEVCSCAGVSAGAVRACGSLEQVRDTTRATTGCGGCAPTVRQLLATRPALSV